MLLREIPVKCICLLITSICLLSHAGTLSIRDDMNKYYEKIDESFSRLSKSAALYSTSLSSAEKLFVKELRKNLAYYVLIRTNSKGVIISEAVRGKKIERPNRNAERERWFQEVKKSKEPYYSISKDDDRGRYYLIWSKPILKNNVFIGAVTTKIDLWDSFYEFSNSVYYPFLIRLNGLSLFSHKWNNDFTHKEERLTIPGINRISVRFIPEKKQEVSQDQLKSDQVLPESQAPQKDTLVQVSAKCVLEDSVGTQPKDEKPEKGNTILIIAIVLLAASLTGGIISFVMITKKRRQEFLKELDES